MASFDYRISISLPSGPLANTWIGVARDAVEPRHLGALSAVGYCRAQHGREDGTEFRIQRRRARHPGCDTRAHDEGWQAYRRYLVEGGIVRRIDR